jgi:hypothetical protein
MKRKLRLIFPLISLTLVTTILFSSSAGAAFRSNNLIDDGFLDNYNSMNAAQINAFLNTFFILSNPSLALTAELRLLGRSGLFCLHAGPFVAAPLAIV